jgi:hypothetical protein
MVQQSEVERQGRLALLLPSMMSMPLRVRLPSLVGYSTRSLAHFQFILSGQTQVISLSQESCALQDITCS